jgi:hypothetical protein
MDGVEHLLGELVGDVGLARAGVAEEGGELVLGCDAEEALGAESSMTKASKRVRPATAAMSSTRKVMCPDDSPWGA